MACGNESSPTRVVAPVVVNPENDSKSIGNGEVWAFRENKRQRTHAAQHGPEQHHDKKSFAGFQLALFPTVRPPQYGTDRQRDKKVCVNALPAPSRYISATSPGRIIVPENKITSSPTIRVMARKCISAASFILKNEVGIILQSLTIAMNHG